MRKSRFIVPKLAGMALLPLSCTSEESLPNIIYVFPDQMRGSAMGFWSEEPYKSAARITGDPVVTPRLDSFARESVVLTSAYSNCPVSSPHRGSLLTGMYPHRSGIPINCHSGRPYSSLRDDVECIGDVFSSSGYDCAYIGKYHANYPTRNDPQHPGEYVESRDVVWDTYTPSEKRHGFNWWYSYGTFDVHKNPHYWDSDGNRHEPQEWSPAHEAGVAASYILNREGQRDPKKPFLMVVSMNPPHSPYNSTEDCEERDYLLYKDKTLGELLPRPNVDTTMAKAGCAPYYFASVSGVDRAFGVILDALKEASLEDNTIVVFASDHGETLCCHGVKDAKNCCYTEATNIPFIVRYPGRLAPRTDDLLLSSPDIFPTLLGLAGLSSRIPHTVQGRNLSEFLFDKNNPEERPETALYIKNDDGPFSSGDLDIPYFPSSRGVHTHRYTLCVNIERDATLRSIVLYDEVKDPFQMRNVWEEAPLSLRDSLLSQLGHLLKDTGDPWWEGGVLSDVINYQDAAVPSLSQIRWHEAEMGALFHYDLHVFDGKRYVQSENRLTPVEDYNMFNPDSLDTDQWIRSAKEAGCSFALLTATHETGFGLWQSDVNPYSLRALKWKDGKADIVGDFVESCRKYGVEPGLYIGIRWNSHLGICNFNPRGEGEYYEKRKEWYRHYCEQMVEELCSRYGPLFMVWFDGGADDPKGDGPDVEPIFAKYQPDCLFYHNAHRADLRWGGSESGTVAYPCWSTFPTPYSHTRHNESESDHLDLLSHGDLQGKFWVPAMADVPLRSYNGRHEWFWEPDDEGSVLPLDSLMDIYRGSVGRNATLILGLAPDPHGLIPEGDRKRLAEFGRSINGLYSNPDASVSGRGTVFDLELKGDCPVDRSIISEEISYGERIRNYRIEALTVDGWKVVCEGQSVGHKRIETFPEVNASRLRLVIDGYEDTPVLKEFSAYYKTDEYE